MLLAAAFSIASDQPHAVNAIPPAACQAELPGWELEWADEFELEGRPNPKNWTYEVGFVRNEELQWYRAENAICANGLLVIAARRERFAPLPPTPQTPEWAKRRSHADYTSASLTTKGLHQWRYGRFEIRARIDTRSGLWPVFWTLGVSGEWPHSGEIDMMESYQGALLANAFWGCKERWVPVSSINRFPLGRFHDPAWSEHFHVWRMDWDEERIRFFVDGESLCQIDLARTFNEDRAGENPLRQPHYLLLSLAVGGTQGGDPSETEFPAKVEVDYVRVFRRGCRAVIFDAVGNPRAWNATDGYFGIVEVG